MTDMSQATLFDRLVSRTATSRGELPVIAAPPLRAEWCEEIIEELVPSPRSTRPPSTPPAALPATAPSAPARAAEPAPLRVRDVAPVTPAVAPPPSPTAPEPAPSPVHHTRTIRRTVFEDRPASPPPQSSPQHTAPSVVAPEIVELLRPVEPHRIVETVRPVAAPRPLPQSTGNAPPDPHAVPRVLPVVRPDLPPAIPAPKPASAAAPRVPDPEPVIHVTIGRLEVRAPERTRPTPAPRERNVDEPSLEQFLARRRAGGGA